MPLDLHKLHEELENEWVSYIKKGAQCLSKIRRSLKHVVEWPRYREAYPQLDIVQAKAAFDRGDIICEFTDRFDEPLGVARFDIRGDRCQLEYEIRFPFTETRTDWKEFQLVLVPNGIAKNRVMILCPRCTTKKKILFFKKDKWSCASCLKLSFRSQLIHPLSRRWEKFYILANRLESGKPHGMHNKTYIILLSHLELLRKELYGKQHRFASDKYSDILKCIWRSPIPRDGFSIPSIKAAAGSVERAKALSELATRPLISPFPSDGGVKRVFRGGFETSDPDDL